MRITRARNYQNVVMKADFAALDPNQERLRRELASVGITYFYRSSSEANVRRDDAVTLDEAALAVACLGFPVASDNAPAHQSQLTNALTLIVTAKGESRRLTDRDGTIYRQLFASNLSGIRLHRAVQMYRFIDQILAGTELSESSYERRMFFRHARYFIMAFVAREARQILAKAQLTLSAEDQEFLSRRTNVLSETIYALSAPLQGTKGYLAVFRNLTECQQLANLVVQSLNAPNVQSTTA